MDAAATAGYVIRNSWAGRSVGRALLVLGLAVCVYQAYRRWRMRRNLQRLAGKVVLITGASSGLGEGEEHSELSDCVLTVIACSTGSTLSFCGGQSHSCLTECPTAAENQVSAGERSRAKGDLWFIPPITFHHCLLFNSSRLRRATRQR